MNLPNAHLLVLSGCAAPLINEPAWKAAVRGDAAGDLELLNIKPWVVSNLPKSRSGNRSQYTVFDKTYQVLDSAENFRERGLASWYGSKFHGRATASGEPYDMYISTAAHRNLPLPTFVRVTRTDNHQSIIVKVNDRGPFVGDRVIDLSFAAAAQLNMLRSGTTEVIVEALSTHVSPPVQVASAHKEPELPQQESAVSQVAESVAQYVQVGAYANRANASNMLSRLQGKHRFPAFVDFENKRQLYRVRIGPLSEQAQIDAAMAALANSGIQGITVEAPTP